MAAPAHRPHAQDARPCGVRRSRPYLGELESLRGLAILLVYAFHLDLSVMARYFTPHDSENTLGASLVRGGYTGVGLFFVLSGFLLGGEFVAEVQGGPIVSRRRYFARRALRILPLYYAAVAIASVTTASRAADLLLGLPYLVFLNAFERFDVPLGSFSAVWWSLATEAQFYALLPLLASLLRPARRRIGAALLAAYGIAYAAFVFGIARPAEIRTQVMLAHSLFGQAPLFAAGAAAAWLYEHYGAQARAGLAGSRLARAGGDAALIVALLGLAALLRWTLTFGTVRDAPPFVAWHLAEALLWAGVVLLVLLAPLRLAPFLCNPALGALGVISYSIYIVHVPLLAAVLTALRRNDPRVLVGWTWRAAVFAVAASTLCFTVAWVVYRVVERPFLARKARLEL